MLIGFDFLFIGIRNPLEKRRCVGRDS